MGPGVAGPAPVALLCDYGGVLTTSLFEASEQLCRDHGVDHSLFRATLRTLRESDDPIARIERGEIDTAMFELQFGPLLTEALQGRLEGSRFLDLMVPLVVAEPRMADAVDVLREAGVRTALVSNSWSDDYPPEVLERFDAVVISGRIGMRKPEPEIYLHAADALDVSPSACVFVDDFEVNVEAARKLGMRAVLHTDVELTLRQLADAFGVDLFRPRVPDRRSP